MSSNRDIGVRQTGSLDIGVRQSVFSSGALTKAVTDAITFSDVISSFLGLFLADSYTLIEAINVNYLGNLTRNLVDSYTLSDGLELDYTFFLTEALNLLDSVITQLRATLVTVADSYSLTDSVITNLIGILSEILTDSYTLADALLIGVDYFLSPTDYFSFLDHLISFAVVLKTQTDNLLLTDAIKTAFSSSPSFSDNFSLNDAISLNLLIDLFSTDTFIFIDATVINNGLESVKSPSDSLIFLDSTSIYLDQGLDTYIRHYLNDVIN